MQWGTPSDLEDFNWYSDVFNKIINRNFNQNNIYEGCLLMPMAGEGSRFQKKGYKIPKPFIKISGSEMYIKAIKDLRINYLTIHISSGLDALQAAKKISGKIKLIGVEASGRQSCPLYILLEKPGYP